MGCLFLFSTFIAENMIMEPVLLPVAYLPPVSWMAYAVQSGSILLEMHETYPKQTYRNRCKIATSTGILSLTVPVKRVKGNHTKTIDIQIDNSNRWQQLHWRSIVTAYNKTPYFQFYRDVIEPVFHQNYTILVDLNLDLLKLVLQLLKLSHIEIINTIDYTHKPDVYDLRNSFDPKIKPITGTTGVLPRYMQAFEATHGFLPDLSIIDLLFNLGPDTQKYLADIKLA